MMTERLKRTEPERDMEWVGTALDFTVGPVIWLFTNPLGIMLMLVIGAHWWAPYAFRALAWWGDPIFGRMFDLSCH